MHAAAEMQKAGATGLLSVTPYYNKPTQEGLFQHYKAIADSTPLPIVLYNVPGRTGCNIEPATVARLATIENIVAVKEASGNMTQMAEVCRIVPDDFIVVSGDDALTVPLDRDRRPRDHLGCVKRNSLARCRRWSKPQSVATSRRRARCITSCCRCC